MTDVQGHHENDKLISIAKLVDADGQRLGFRTQLRVGSPDPAVTELCGHTHDTELDAWQCDTVAAAAMAHEDAQRLFTTLDTVVVD